MSFLLLLASSFSLPAFADYYACPKALHDNRKAAEAVEYLQKMSGAFQMGRCLVQLQMCDSTKIDESGSEVVGDLMVTDEFGRSFYLQLDFSNAQTEKTNRLILVNKRMVHYESLNRIPNRQDGRSQNFRLEIVKNGNEDAPSELDLGIYTSRTHREYSFIPPGKSYWVNCRK